MKACPVCGTELQEVGKYGVQIDTCPRCRGVWLDRGELEKVMGMAREEYAPGPGTRPRWHDDDREEGGYRRDDDDDRHHHPAHGHKKKRGFLNMFEDMFE